MWEIVGARRTVDQATEASDHMTREREAGEGVSALKHRVRGEIRPLVRFFRDAAPRRGLWYGGSRAIAEPHFLCSPSCTVRGAVVQHMSTEHDDPAHCAFENIEVRGRSTAAHHEENPAASLY